MYIRLVLILIFIALNPILGIAQQNISPETFATAQKNKGEFFKYLSLKLWTLDTLKVYGSDKNNHWVVEGIFSVLEKNEKGLPETVEYKVFDKKSGKFIPVTTILIEYYPNDTIKTYFEKVRYGWLKDTLLYYKLSKKGQIIQKVIKEYDNKLLSLTSREALKTTYNASKKLKKVRWTSHHGYENGTIDTVYSYNQDGKLKRKEIYERYRQKDFEYKTKTIYEYTYNDRKLLDQVIVKEFDYDTRRTYLLTMKKYKYDVFGKPILIENYYYGDTSWLPESRVLITEYPGWMVKRVTQKYLNKKWVTITREEVYYNAHNLPFEIDFYYFRNGLLYSAKRKILKYNLQDRLISVLNLEQTDGHWQNVDKTSYRYSFGKLRTIVKWRWNDSLQIWQYYSRKDYYYNPDGYLTQLAEYAWNPNIYDTLLYSGDWYKIRKLEMKYSASQITINTLNDKLFAIFPNPTVSRIKILSAIDLKNSKITIFSPDGKQISKFTVSLNEIDLSGLKPGKYILRITTRRGIYQTRILKL